MVTLHIEGLCICVFDHTADKLRVCLLNAGYDEALGIPHHIPTLAANRASIDQVGRAPLGSVKGRLSASRFDDATHAAWDLSGVVASVDGGAGIPAKHCDVLPLHHPDPLAPDWSPLHWVLPFERYLPGCTVPKDVQQLGPKTSAIVEVTGGKCFGGVPATLGGDANVVWYFNLGVDQAVTDTMDVTFNTAPTLTMSDEAGSRVGQVTVRDGAELWLVNEATDRDIRLEKEVYDPGLPENHGRHLHAYLAVLDNLPPIVPWPKEVLRWRDVIVDGTFCIVGRTDQA